MCNFEKAVLIKMNMMTNMALEVLLKNSVPGESSMFTKSSQISFLNW